MSISSVMQDTHSIDSLVTAIIVLALETVRDSRDLTDYCLQTRPFHNPDKEQFWHIGTELIK